MRHAVIVQELEKEQAFVVEIDVLLLRVDFLRAIAFLVEIFLFERAGSWAVEHVDERDLREIDECDVVEDRLGVLIDDKYFLVHAWEELLHAVSAVVFEELHELRLINDVKKGDIFLVVDLLWNFDSKLFT